MLQILATLKDKVVIGHSVYNDFEVLDINHPGHMVRDTSTSPLLSRLAGLSCKRSLKVLTSKLLNRKIQVSQDEEQMSEGMVTVVGFCRLHWLFVFSGRVAGGAIIQWRTPRPPWTCINWWRASGSGRCRQL